MGAGRHRLAEKQTSSPPDLKTKGFRGAPRAYGDGASPLVDVANTKVGERLGDELLTATPTTPSSFGAVALLPGVVMRQQDIGGTAACPRVTAHGATADQVNLMGNHAEGPQHNGSYCYVDFNMMEEESVETAGMGAEVGPGGAQINIIPQGREIESADRNWRVSAEQTA